MMRVLNVLVGLERGGIETFLMNVYSNINKSEIQFDFLITEKKDTDYKKEILKYGGNVYTYSSRRDSVWRNYKEVDCFFKKHKYSIVHFHISSLSNIAPIYAAYRNNVKNIIIHSHSSNTVGILHKMLHRINKKIIKKIATHFFACSNEAASWMFPNSIFLKKDFTIIPNGILLEKFSFSEEKRKTVRKSLDIDENTLVFGHVGRLSFPKNHLFLLEVFKCIHNSQENSKLILVGKGERKSIIRQKIKELHLSSDVIFYGESNNVDYLMSSFDAFILPSFYEGLPVVLVEAQTSGLPCFVSNSITKDVKLTNFINYLSLDNSPSFWAYKIIENIKKNSLNRYVVSKSIRAFDIKEVSKKIENFYFNINLD